MWSENIHICRRFLEIPAGDQNRHTTDPVEKIMFILRGTGHRLEPPGRFTKGRVSPKSFKEDVIYNLYSTFGSQDKRTRQKTRHTLAGLIRNGPEVTEVLTEGPNGLFYLEI